MLSRALEYNSRSISPSGQKASTKLMISEFYCMVVKKKKNESFEAT